MINISYRLLIENVIYMIKFSCFFGSNVAAILENLAVFSLCILSPRL